jgi:hypothetical protein
MFQSYKMVTRDLQVCQCRQCVRIGGLGGLVKGRRTINLHMMLHGPIRRPRV